MKAKLTKVSTRQRHKLTNRTRMTLTALSMMSFLVGWNLVGRLENQMVQVDDPLPTPIPLPLSIRPTAWPTIASLTAIPPIPTLIPPRTTWQPDQTDQAHITSYATPLELAPMSTPAPLPTLVPLPPIPVLPPPPLAATGGGGSGNRSGGS